MTDSHHPQLTPYAGLNPQLLLDAIEQCCGLECDGRLQALNSFENRVYQVGLADGSAVVAKFYRPERWSAAAIQEEHDFAFALAAREIPIVAPLLLHQRTRHEYAGFQFAVYPKRGGARQSLKILQYYVGWVDLLPESMRLVDCNHL